MGIVFRQSVNTSIVLLTGAVLGGLIIWLSTKYVPKQELGFMNNFTRWALLLSVFVPFGLTSTLAVYIHRYANADLKRKMLITFCLLLPLIITIIVSVVYLLIPSFVLRHFQPGDVPLMQKYYGWLPVYTVLFLYMAILEQYLCTQMKVAVSAFMREVLVRVCSLVLLLLFSFQYISFQVLFTGTILIYLLPVSIFFLLSFKTKGFGFFFRIDAFSNEEYRDMAHFTWYHFLLMISLTLMNMMDSLLIPFYDRNGFSSVAVYVVACYIVTILYMPSKAFLQSSFTVLARAFAENDLVKAKDIFIRSSTNIFIPCVGIAIILSCNLENISAIVGNGKNYSGIILTFLIMLIGQMINFATGMNDQVLSITNYYKFNFYLSLSLIVVFYILIRILVPRYGIYGAAWSSTITFALFNTWKCAFIWKKLDMQPFSGKTALIVIAALPALAGGYFFPYFFDPGRHVYVHTFVDAVMRSTVITVIYLLMLLWLKPSKDLEEYIASVRRNKRLF